MNFFEQQDLARRRTNKLVAYFVLAVVAIITAVYLAAVTGWRIATPNYGQPAGWWQPTVFAWSVLGTLSVILLGTLWKTLRLRQGGGAVARMLGGVPIAPGTTDADEKKLLNVVEEMAIASGTAVPELYLLPGESAINAFAAGYHQNDAAIGVTRGAVRALTRDELQGVVAHEFSHILHGDSRLNIRLIGLLNGILVIGLLGYFMLRSFGFGLGRRRRGGGDARAAIAIFAAGATMVVIGYVGVFFGRLIKAAVSRQREYLADASAVQYTRNPDGIAGALKKIGGLGAQSHLVNAHAEEASHMFFGRSNRKKLLFNAWLATHPPLEKRIRAIDPSFDGTFEPVASDFQAPFGIHPAAAGLAPSAAPAAATASAAISSPTSPLATPADLLSHIGDPTPAHVAQSARLLAALPEAVRAAAHEPFGAQALVFGLLLDGDSAMRQAQLAALERAADPPAYVETLRLAPLALSLPHRARLPVIDLAIPALRQLSPRQFTMFTANVQALIEADAQLSLFEFTLQKVLRRHLTPSRRSVAYYGSFGPVLDDLRLLLSTLAYAGHADQETAQSAFAAAARLLGAAAQLQPLDASACTWTALDEALDKLDRTTPAMKQRVLQAAAESVAHDGQVTLEEAELLRAVADSLGCPMPPAITEHI